MNASPRILIIRLSSLGDILHTLPAFASLRASCPDARIDWLVAKKCEFLMAAVPGIHTLHVLNTNALLRLPPSPTAWRSLFDLIRNLQATRYNYSIDFQGLLKTAFLGAVSRSSTRLGFSKALVREHPAHWFYHKTLAKPPAPVHVTVLNRMLAELSGARPEPSHFEFQVSEEDRRHIDSFLREEQLDAFVVINPGGGWPTKRWAPEKYGALAKRIRAELGLRSIVTTGPGEEILYHTIADNCGNAAPLHFPVTFLQLIPLLMRARLIIGGDTGPFHLACALGVPVVGIFGPTSPVRNGPWREEDESIAHRLPCSACHARICSTGAECMNISMEEVFAAVVRRLKKLEDFTIVRS
jgi:heptosyltransferase I